MGKKYLIDTNIIIYYLNNSIIGKSREFIQSALNDSFNISFITKIEMLSYHKLKKKEEKVIRDMLSIANIFTISDEITEKVIDIKKEYNIKVPDAIIAATAIENNFTLISRNVNDFNRIVGLKNMNPFE